MIEQVDVQSIKNKFSVLLSKLYTNSKLSLDQINEKILTSDYFDFLENNDTEAFVMSSYESIAKDVFMADSVFSEEVLSQLFWAGLMYMSITLNKRIPLKQVFLLCPLEQMVSYFEVYHEMHEGQLINAFLRDEYKGSILRKLRARKGFSVRQLSSTTGIAEYTIKYYEKDNNNLFSASFENIKKLQQTLDCSESFFKRESSFVPFSRVFVSSKELFESLCNCFDEMYRTKGAGYIFDGLMFIRETQSGEKKKREFVREEFVKSSILKVAAMYSKTDELIF